MTSRDEHQTAASVARLEAQAYYLDRGQTQAERRTSEVEGRLGQVEAHLLRNSALPEQFKAAQDRLLRVEAEVRLIKLVAGLGMLVLASSGTVSGAGEKVLRTLLGIP